jgi:hypothetical protein
MMIDHSDLDSRYNPIDGDDSSRQSPSPNRSYSSVDNSPGHPSHQEAGRPPQDPSLALFHAPNASSSHILGKTPQEPLPFNSDPPPNEPAQPGPPVPASSPTVLPTSVDAAYIAPHINLPTHNLVDTPPTNSSSPAPHASPTHAPPAVSDSSTRLSAIQTVETYLNHQTQAIQSHLTAVLPGLIQEEVRTQCAQLAQEIGAQISSIQKEVISPTGPGDQDDPMLPFSEEVENEGSRGHGKRSARRHYSQQPNNNDDSEADEDKDSDEGISMGSR